MRRFPLILIFMLFFLGEAQARKLGSVIRLKSPGHVWQLNEEVCFVTSMTSIAIACGSVVRVSPNEVSVKIDAINRDASLMTGGRMTLVPAERAPDSRAELVTYEVKETYGPSYDAAVSVGAVAGFSYFFPVAHFQLALSNWIVAGVMPAFASAEKGASSVKVFGALGTFQVFPSGRPFEGLGLELGGGFYSFNLNNNGTKLNLFSPALQLSGSWHWAFSFGMILGLRMGTQLVLNVENNVTNLNLSGPKPLVALEIGYGF